MNNTLRVELPRKLENGYIQKIKIVEGSLTILTTTEISTARHQYVTLSLYIVPLNNVLC